MSTAVQNIFVSEEDYLEGELHAEIRHEYIDGHVYAMSGAHSNHNLITGNLYRRIGNHLDGKPCTPFASDMKVKIASRYFYPDVLVDCAGVEGYFSEHPVLVVEVLSASTRRLDETTKRAAYLQIPSLLEYVLIEQDMANVEVQRRRNGWQSEHFYLGDEVTFESVGLTLPVAAIYDRVKNSDVAEWLARGAEG